MTNIWRKKVYLAGPMTGYDQLNYPLFHSIAAELRERGMKVYNPAEFSWTEEKGADFPLADAMQTFTDFITHEAEAVLLLPGWEHSKGTAVEVATAQLFKKPLYEVIIHNLNDDSDIDLIEITTMLTHRTIISCKIIPDRKVSLSIRTIGGK